MAKFRRIPECDDLEFRVKDLRKGEPPVRLNQGESALYIGSGPRLDKVTHLLELVDASRYVLSDLEFDRATTHRYRDGEVTGTNQDGFALIAADTTIRCVMIDQAVQGSIEEAYNNMQVGTVVYIHTIDSFHPRTMPAFQERIGASRVRGRKLFRKERNASSKDFEVAHAVYGILTNPLHEVPFLREEEPPELVARLKTELYSRLDEPYASYMAKAEVAVLLCAPRSRYQVYQETDAQTSATDIDSLLASMNDHSTVIPEPLYDAERILRDTQELITKVQEVLPSLNTTEKEAIHLRLQTTSNDLATRRSIEYHEQMRVCITECLEGLRSR